MFNPNLKNEYLSDCKNKNRAISVFKRSEKYEVAVNTDLCALDADTVKAIISNHSGNNVKNVRNTISTIRGYCSWCEHRGIEINQDLFNIKQVDQSIGIKRTMVSSPARLKSILDIIFSKPEEETDECLIKCFLWCAFLGVPTEISGSVLKILKQELDLDNNVVTIAGQRYELYKESIDDFYNLKFLDQFAFEHPGYKNKIYRKRVGGNYLFRGLESGKNKTGYITKTALVSRIDKKMKGMDRSLRYSDIYLSGIFYRAYELELEGFEPDFTKHLQYRFGDVDLTRLPRGSMANTQNRISAQSWYRDTLTNYNNWKKAFRLQT